MNPVYRRSTKFYLWSALTYLAIMGRYMVTRDWPVFEIIPIFMPVWLVSALFASEDDERYAFLRMLPVPDRDIARAKLVLILGSAAFQWTLMTGAALARMDEGIADAPTLVYLTLVCAFGLLVAAGCQLAVWRFGISRMKPILIAGVIAGLAIAIIHLASLKNVDNWPALSRSAVVEWLGGAPWISNVLIAALALLVFHALLRVGIRVKAACEAHL